MTVWRICHQKWKNAAFSGIGATDNPGRWNSSRERVVYCASSRALAALEILSHVGNKRILRQAQFVIIPVQIPDGLVDTPRELPPGWDNQPPASSRKFGDRFVSNSTHPVLRIPSAIIQGEFCYVLNPGHADFKQLLIGEPESFAFGTHLLP